MCLTVITLLLAVSNLSAATLYVSAASTNPTPPYATWATAATTIQDAVDAAGAGDEVVVTNGTYAIGGRAGNRVAVDKPLTLTSVNGPEVTVILGDHVPGDTNGVGPVTCVYLTNGAGLCGFTLTHRATQQWPPGSAGGVWCESTNAFLANCVIVGNAVDNKYGNGGGAYSCTLSNCTLTGNSAGYGGGASGCTLYNCLLTDNESRFAGGAYGSTLYNCTVCGNGASQTYEAGAGGAWDCTLYNCIVYFNVFTGLSVEYDWAGCTLNYCCTPIPPTNGVGNITNAPLFADYASGDLQLQPDSPCIDAGNIAYAPGPADLDGNPRIVNGTVDMGAYEFQRPGSGPPVVVSQPTSQTNNAGTTVAFRVFADGSQPLSFQWLRDGVPLVDGGNRAGAGTAVLTLTNVLGADAAGYSVVVSNGLGSVDSAVATLAVIDPVIAVPPASQIGQWGQSVTLSVTAVGTAPLAYQWLKEEVALAGGTGAFLTLTNLQTGDGGQYSVVVSNRYGSATSAVALLTMNLAMLDTGFNPGANIDLLPLAVQADGKILVGGYFTTLGGQSCTNIGRLNADGTVDSGFSPGAYGTGPAGGLAVVASLALQADRKILVGGYFATLAGQPRTNLGRLNADGTLDDGFNPGPAGGYPTEVNCLAVQADGKILVGGSFTTLDGQPRNCLGRLNADGTLDSGLDPGPGPAGGYPTEVACLAVQADGKILVGGYFATLGGQPLSYLGRLNQDGTEDTGFNPGPDDLVISLALQADGQILAGGYFTTLDGQTRTNIGRLNNTGPATQSLTFDGSAITWLRGGASPEVWRTTFDFSTNGSDWASLGAGARIAGGWQFGSVSLPSASGTLRARGYVQDQGSAWFVETDLAVSPPPVILVNDPSFGLSSNCFGFKLSGSAGQVVIVEASANLATWTPVATNTLGATPLYFSEPQWTNYPARFYRLRCP